MKGILWVLWLATGALWATAFATDSLSEALEAFSWLNWLARMFFSIYPFDFLINNLRQCSVTGFSSSFSQ